jgi:prepilin-type N-terminal cleavage/methylation domain-containing protein
MLQKGFTLVELMIVVAIIVILAGWGYPQYLEHTAAAKIIEAHGALEGYRSSMEKYFMDNRTYVSAETYTATATAKNNVGLPAIAFQINQTGAKSTSVSNAVTCATGWAKKRSGAC